MTAVAQLQIDRCVCRSTLFADLLPIARLQNWRLDQLIAATGCGGGCGLCRPYLGEMLATGATVFHEIIVPLPDADRPA